MKMSDILFFLQRHATTGSNKKNIYRSWSNAPDAQLDPIGKKEAAEAAEFYASVKAPIELIIADTLDRVVETCEAIALKFPQSKMEMVRGLHPLNMGDWTGKSKDAHPVGSFLKDKSKKIPGGETVNDFNHREERVFGLIFDIARNNPGGHIIVGGHGSTVAYLYNQVFKQGDEIGYEGMVDPGGIIAVTETGMYPLTKAREKKKLQDRLVRIATYPPDHQAGMKVPPGGSNCAKCEYLGEDKLTCTNKYFIEWNGSDVIPGKIDEYCSDWFETGETQEKKDGSTT
jgi:broad specificity phosphatase PhoE